MLRRRVLADAVAEVEHVAVAARRRPCVEAGEQRRRPRCGSPPGPRTARSDRGCPAARRPRRGAVRAAPRSTVQSTPTTSAPSAPIASSHGPPPLVKTICGTRRPSASRLSCASTRCDVGQAEALERAVGEHAAPAVEDHHRLGAGVDLRVQVERDGVGVDRQDAMHQVGPRVEHGLDQAVVVGAARPRPCSRRASRGCRRSRSAAPGRPARGGSRRPHRRRSGACPCRARRGARPRPRRAPDARSAGLRPRRTTGRGPSRRARSGCR